MDSSIEKSSSVDSTLGTLSSGNADGDGDAETCGKPHWRENAVVTETELFNVVINRCLIGLARQISTCAD